MTRPRRRGKTARDTATCSSCPQGINKPHARAGRVASPIEEVTRRHRVHQAASHEAVYNPRRTRTWWRSAEQSDARKGRQGGRRVRPAACAEAVEHRRSRLGQATISMLQRRMRDGLRARRAASVDDMTAARHNRRCRRRKAAHGADHRAKNTSGCTKTRANDPRRRPLKRKGYDRIDKDGWHGVAGLLQEPRGQRSLCWATLADAGYEITSPIPRTPTIDNRKHLRLH